MSLAKLLAPFRKGERLEDTAGFVDQPVGVQMLAAWPRVGMTWDKPEGRAPGAADSAERWGWIWSGFAYDRSAMARFAGTDEGAVKSWVLKAVEARLVYPDGTLSGPAAKLVSGYIERRQPGRPGRPKGVVDGGGRGGRLPKRKRPAKETA